MPRVCVIGLDCLTPQLALDRFWPQMPCLRAIAARGFAARLRSSQPPITVPAWTCMVTGVDPGSLGVYGFHDRADYSYDRRRLASSLSFRQPTLWHRLTAAGMRSRIIGVPQTYPPRPFAGEMVTGCLTPGRDAAFTHPPDIATRVEATAGGWQFDVDGFRDRPPQEVADEIRRMTESRFRLARAWVQRDDWHLFMMVDMGPDRMQHKFWHAMQASDGPEGDRGAFGDAIASYHALLDDEIGRLTRLLRPDDAVLVVSDHGAQAMRGAVAINDWLREQGYLVLRRPPATPEPLTPELVDWPATSAWADGGYVGRVHLNIKGREPQGRLAASDAARVVEEVRHGLERLPGPHGEAMQTRCWRPEEIYRAWRGVPPALLVYFDDLRRRAAGSVGHAGVHLSANDRGPDGANHSELGVLVLGSGDRPRAAPQPEASIYDIAPTILGLLGVTRSPDDMIGRDLQG